ncbi:hypothetical protein THAOC_20367, partial [Thalassiosira oceanica]
MDRLTGIERPYEPSPTSYSTRVKAGATRPAQGGHWEPHNAYRSRNFTRIQVNHDNQREDTAVLRRRGGGRGRARGRGRGKAGRALCTADDGAARVPAGTGRGATPRLRPELPRRGRRRR